MKYSGEFGLERATDGSAGFDLRVRGYVEVGPGEIEMVNTGIRVAIPDGYVGLTFIRSSIATNRDLQLANGVGVIDSDYRGEILLPIWNAGEVVQAVGEGDRIAQIVVVPFMGDAEWVADLDETVRGEGGFGSTGNA